MAGMLLILIYVGNSIHGDGGSSRPGIGYRKLGSLLNIRYYGSGGGTCFLQSMRLDWESPVVFVVCEAKAAQDERGRSYFYQSEYGHLLERIMIDITRYVLLGRLVK